MFNFKQLLSTIDLKGQKLFNIWDIRQDYICTFLNFSVNYTIILFIDDVSDQIDNLYLCLAEKYTHIDYGHHMCQHYQLWMINGFNDCL